MRKSKVVGRIVRPVRPIIVERLAPTGQGVGTLTSVETEEAEKVAGLGIIEGMKVFLWNALPGEKVAEFQITKKRSHLIEGIATEILEESPDRILPRDAQFLSTSPWQILDEKAEKREKEKLLSEIFRNVLKMPGARGVFGGAETALARESGARELQAKKADAGKQRTEEFGAGVREASVGEPQISLTESPENYFYRNKMEYALYFDLADEKIKLAMHTRGSHRKVPIESSSIERPEIFARAQEIVDALNRDGDEARRYQSLILRCNRGGEVSGGLLENRQPHPKFPDLTDSLLGHEYSYSPNGFFQVNLPVYEMVLKRIKELIRDDLEVLDLYSGVGTIGLTVARDRKLTLVEVDKAAYEGLEKNVARAEMAAEGRELGDNLEDAWTATTEEGVEKACRFGGAAHITPVLAKSEEVLEYIQPDQVVILDPPRAGCDRKLIERLLKVHPKQIIYLSCNPATQARDIGWLLGDYQLKTIEAFNFFPRTPHIECLVSLE